MEDILASIVILVTNLLDFIKKLGFLKVFSINQTTNDKIYAFIECKKLFLPKQSLKLKLQWSTNCYVFVCGVDVYSD